MVVQEESLKEKTTVLLFQAVLKVSLLQIS